MHSVAHRCETSYEDSVQACHQIILCAVQALPLIDVFDRRINETHQQLNGELRSELQKAQSENIKSKNLLQGYKKVIEELTDKLRKRS